MKTYIYYYSPRLGILPISWNHQIIACAMVLGFVLTHSYQVAYLFYSPV